jgi:hypothetical protein
VALWKICGVIAVFSLPIGGIMTMFALPAAQRAGAPPIIGFAPFLIVPAVTFVVAALLGIVHRALTSRGAPAWLSVLICCALLLFLGGASIVAMLGASFVGYQRLALVPPGQQVVEAAVTELDRLDGTEDPGDRVAALDIQATPGCVVEGRFFIQRGEISREIPELIFAAHSDPAWGRWNARVKVTARNLQCARDVHPCRDRSSRKGRPGLREVRPGAVAAGSELATCAGEEKTIPDRGRGRRVGALSLDEHGVRAGGTRKPRARYAGPKANRPRIADHDQAATVHLLHHGCPGGGKS